MKLLVDVFANHIYLYLVNFVGKASSIQNVQGKILILILLKKKPKLSMLLISTKHILSVLHALLHLFFNLNVFILI